MKTPFLSSNIGLENTYNIQLLKKIAMIDFPNNYKKKFFILDYFVNNADEANKQKHTLNENIVNYNVCKKISNTLTCDNKILEKIKNNRILYNPKLGKECSGVIEQLNCYTSCTNMKKYFIPNNNNIVYISKETCATFITKCLKNKLEHNNSTSSSTSLSICEDKQLGIAKYLLNKQQVVEIHTTINDNKEKKINPLHIIDHKCYSNNSNKTHTLFNINESNLDILKVKYIKNLNTFDKDNLFYVEYSLRKNEYLDFVFKILFDQYYILSTQHKKVIRNTLAFYIDYSMIFTKIYKDEKMINNSASFDWFLYQFVSFMNKIRNMDEINYYFSFQLEEYQIVSMVLISECDYTLRNIYSDLINERSKLKESFNKYIKDNYSFLYSGFVENLTDFFWVNKLLIKDIVERKEKAQIPLGEYGRCLNDNIIYDGLKEIKIMKQNSTKIHLEIVKNITKEPLPNNKTVIKNNYTITTSSDLTESKYVFTNLNSTLFLTDNNHLLYNQELALTTISLFCDKSITTKNNILDIITNKYTTFNYTSISQNTYEADILKIYKQTINDFLSLIREQNRSITEQINTSSNSVIRNYYSDILDKLVTLVDKINITAITITKSKTHSEEDLNTLINMIKTLTSARIIEINCFDKIINVISFIKKIYMNVASFIDEIEYFNDILDNGNSIDHSTEFLKNKIVSIEDHVKQLKQDEENKDQYMLNLFEKQLIVFMEIISYTQNKNNNKTFIIDGIEGRINNMTNLLVMKTMKSVKDTRMENYNNITDRDLYLSTYDDIYTEYLKINYKLKNLLRILTKYTNNLLREKEKENLVKQEKDKNVKLVREKKDKQIKQEELRKEQLQKYINNMLDDRDKAKIAKDLEEQGINGIIKKLQEIEQMKLNTQKDEKIDELISGLEKVKSHNKNNEEKTTKPKTGNISKIISIFQDLDLYLDTNNNNNTKSPLKEKIKYNIKDLKQGNYTEHNEKIDNITKQFVENKDIPVENVKKQLTDLLSRAEIEKKHNNKLEKLKQQNQINNILDKIVADIDKINSGSNKMKNNNKEIGQIKKNLEAIKIKALNNSDTNKKEDDQNKKIDAILRELSSLDKQKPSNKTLGLINSNLEDIKKNNEVKNKQIDDDILTLKEMNDIDINDIKHINPTELLLENNQLDKLILYLKNSKDKNNKDKDEKVNILKVELEKSITNNKPIIKNDTTITKPVKKNNTIKINPKNITDVILIPTPVPISKPMITPNTTKLNSTHTKNNTIINQTFLPTKPQNNTEEDLDDNSSWFRLDKFTWGIIYYILVFIIIFMYFGVFAKIIEISIHFLRNLNYKTNTYNQGLIFWTMAIFTFVFILFGKLLYDDLLIMTVIYI